MLAHCSSIAVRPRVLRAVSRLASTRRRPLLLPPPPAAAVLACVGGCAAPALNAAQPARFFHATAARSSVTGISFSQPPAAELKVAQWLKKQEILARRRTLHALCASIWSSHPREDWSRLTPARSAELLEQALRLQQGVPPEAPATAAVLPSEWETSEFFAHTLEQKCPWRFAEVQRERKAYFERVLAELMRTLRRESESYMHGSMQMTKNELTRRLTVAMGGKLPSADEVDAAWSDRHQLPAIEWLEDVV